MKRITASEFVRLAEEALVKTDKNFRGTAQETFKEIVRGKSLGATMASYRINVDNLNGRVYGKTSDAERPLTGNAEYVLTGESGNDLITVSGFAKQVRKSWSQWPAQYIEDNARDVMSGKYDNIAPSSGTNIYLIKRENGAVIASTKSKEEDKIKIFELIA